jgi:hypothetical protein
VGDPPAWGLGWGLTIIPVKPNIYYESLRADSELRVFENRFLRRIFGLER